MTDEEKKSLTDRLREFFRRLKEKFNNIFNPQFSVFAQEMQDTMNSLEFNQEVTIETLQEVIDRLGKAEKFISDAENQEKQVLKDLNEFVSQPDMNLAKVTINGKDAYIFYDAWVYDQIYDEQGHFIDDSELLKSTVPDIDKCFRVYAMTNDQYLMNRVDLEKEGIKLSDFGIIRGAEICMEFNKVENSEARDNYLHGLVCGEFDSLINMAHECRDAYKQKLQELLKEKTPEKEDMER